MRKVANKKIEIPKDQKHLKKKFHQDMKFFKTGKTCAIAIIWFIINLIIDTYSKKLKVREKMKGVLVTRAKKRRTANLIQRSVDRAQKELEKDSEKSEMKRKRSVRLLKKLKKKKARIDRKSINPFGLNGPTIIMEGVGKTPQITMSPRISNASTSKRLTTISLGLPKTRNQDYVLSADEITSSDDDEDEMDDQEFQKMEKRKSHLRGLDSQGNTLGVGNGGLLAVTPTHRASFRKKSIVIENINGVEYAKKVFIEDIKDMKNVRLQENTINNVPGSDRSMFRAQSVTGVNKPNYSHGFNNKRLGIGESGILPTQVYEKRNSVTGRLSATGLSLIPENSPRVDINASRVDSDEIDVDQARQEFPAYDFDSATRKRKNNSGSFSSTARKGMNLLSSSRYQDSSSSRLQGKRAKSKGKAKQYCGTSSYMNKADTLKKSRRRIGASRGADDNSTKKKKKPGEGLSPTGIRSRQASASAAKLLEMKEAESSANLQPINVGKNTSPKNNQKFKASKIPQKAAALIFSLIPNNPHFLSNTNNPHFLSILIIFR